MIRRAALGVRMHSGWGVLVVVSGEATSPELVDRKRIIIADLKSARAKQPYHYAATLDLAHAEEYLADCAATSERLATEVISETKRELDRQDCRIVGCAVLMASGRPLPPLPQILVSHALIHTAEGEFFRNAVKNACERLRIRVTAVKEKELEERSKMAYGNAASQVQERVARLGKSVGPPWTQDQKAAALAALMIVAKQQTHVSR